MTCKSSLGLSLLLCACVPEVGSDDESETSTEAGTQTETDTETDTDGATGGIPDSLPACFGVTFIEGVLEPEHDRGNATEDGTDVCQYVTGELAPVRVTLTLPEGFQAAPGATLILRAWEYDNQPSEVIADCVEGLCAELDPSALEWTFLLPNDALENMRYYVTGRIDADNDDDTDNDCVDLFVPPVSFGPEDFAAGVDVVAEPAGDCP